MKWLQFAIAVLWQQPHEDSREKLVYPDISISRNKRRLIFEFIRSKIGDGAGKNDANKAGSRAVSCCYSLTVRSVHSPSASGKQFTRFVGGCPGVVREAAPMRPIGH